MVDESFDSIQEMIVNACCHLANKIELVLSLTRMSRL